MCMAWLQAVGQARPSQAKVTAWPRLWPGLRSWKARAAGSGRGFSIIILFYIFVNKIFSYIVSQIEPSPMWTQNSIWTALQTFANPCGQPESHDAQDGVVVPHLCPAKHLFAWLTCSQDWFTANVLMYLTNARFDICYCSLCFNLVFTNRLLLTQNGRVLASQVVKT